MFVVESLLEHKNNLDFVYHVFYLILSNSVKFGHFSMGGIIAAHGEGGV